MRLRTLQSDLEGIYEVAVEHDVDDFVITDPELARTLDDGPRAREAREKLLVHQDGDDVGIALYLDAAVLQRLREDDPNAALHAGNLDDYWTALEGVSHFLYLTWNAGYERPVSRLELEMQAEVDKYVATAFLLGRQHAGRVPLELRRLLFEGCGYDPSLDEDDLALYRSASHYAGRYCEHLENTYLRDRRRGGMVQELRRFYRLTRDAKLRRAHAH